jgi:arsenite methyltransferase
VSTPEQITACCAAAYSSDAVALLLGESYHPGGAALTRRLASLLRLRAGHRVADIASGPGATACLLATEYGVAVDGVDVAAPTVRHAQARADGAGLSGAVRFHIGNAQRLPFPGNTFDAVLSECAFCTFPDKAAAAVEFARILRPSRRLGLADVTTAQAGLPDELTSLAAWVACIADASPVRGYCDLLSDAGLRILHTEHHDDALGRMIDQIEARVQLASMTHMPILEAAGVSVDAVLKYIDLARQAVTDGVLGYALIIAERR